MDDKPDDKPHSDKFFDFDVHKILGDFKMPGFDVDAVLASQRKNIEALSHANRVAYDGMQAVVKRQVEILRQTMDEVAHAAKGITESGPVHDKAAKQAELAKAAFERALANGRELAEMVAKSNAEAFDTLNKRFTQNLQELRDSFTKIVKK
jgi:phasin family protein